MQAVDPIFLVIGLVMSVVIHEVSHGYAADLLGDPTARFSGRLTLNPLAHLDWFGSVVVPLLLYLLPGGLMFGWAKPVPYNPYNLGGGRAGPALVAAAGPASNLLIALVFGLGIRYAVIPLAALNFAATLVLLNLMLVVFNLLPVFPLDGSKVLFALLPGRWAWLEDSAQRYQLWWLLVLMLLLTQTDFVSIWVYGLFRLIAGV